MENEDKYKVEIKEEERVDDLHRNGYKIIQNPKSFCFGQDAVLLSSFAKVLKGEKVVDLGTGTGIIPILLRAKTQGSMFFGLEIQEASAQMAKRSVDLNEIGESVKIIHGDIKNVLEFFEGGSVDVVTSNPPYMAMGSGIVNEESPKAIARHEVLCSFEDVVKSSYKILKQYGRMYVIHRPHRLTDILHSMRENKIEPKTIQFVQPFKDKEPTMVLVEGIKGSKPMLKVLAPIVIYDEDNKYTDEVFKIYYE